MNELAIVDSEQKKSWNGVAGHHWVEAQALIDQTFRPIENLLIKAIPAGFEGRVLDVGCGTGSTTVRAARRLGKTGACVGIDISEPMIAAAEARAAREETSTSFLLADAQTCSFESIDFDMIISRFGVMFFDDPVAAFANMRQSTTAGAELLFISWRRPMDNSFMTTAERAAAELLPGLPAHRPDEPGQFGFADARRVRRILKESGWTGIRIQPIDVACTLPEPDLIPYFTRFGLVGRVLHEVDDATRAQVIHTVRDAFEPFVFGTEVRYTAACWMVSARAPAA